MTAQSLRHLLADWIHFPHFGRGALAVWRRNFLYFRTSIWVNVLWIFIEPVLYLVAFGFGLGLWIGDIDGEKYVNFLFPGMATSTAMMVAFFESTYGSFTKLTRQRTYHTILQTPVSADEIALGEVLWAASKGLWSSLAVLIVGLSVGLVKTWAVFPAIGLLAMVALSSAAFGLILSSYAPNFEWFQYAQTGFMVPMTMLSGVYFPRSAFPEWLDFVVGILPLTHAVAGVRHLLQGVFHPSVFLSFAILFTLIVILVNWACARMDRRLLQ